MPKLPREASPLKIALVIDDALARPDGVQEYVRSLAAFLGAAGHEVHVMCSGDGGPPPPGVTAVHSLTRNFAVNYNGNSLRTPVPARRRSVRALLLRERFDVIHVMTPHSPFFGGRVVTHARKILGDQVRIIGSFVILPDSSGSERGTRALGRLLRRNLRRFDVFTALSGPAVDFATSAYGVACSPSPAPVDTRAMRAQAAAQPRPATDRFVIAFLGRLVDRKGVLELIAALALLPQELRESLEVRIGGRGPLLEAATAAATDAGLGQTIRFEGFIADADKPGFLAAADIAVFPATGGESFGIVLIEAMAAGAGVVLAGDNAGYSWTIGDPEAVVNPRDPGAFAAVLERLMRDPTARKALHARQQERVEAFDIGVIGAQVEALYRG